MDEPARQRLQLIMQLADERLKLNPKDADALFAMASAQEALDDARGALKSLDRLVDFDSDYPGVWGLKAKLHSRLGQADLAQRSQVQSQERDASGGKTNGSTVPCPICENPVAIDAMTCWNCGATFAYTRSLEDELDDLGHAAILGLVEEEAHADGKPGPPPSEPTKRDKPMPKAAATLGPIMRPASGKGLTNGLVVERSPRRRAGMTNGLKGRTNGLRGRTNGRTNGLGRTNGITNGVGQTNGLTNGLGRTNGLTNGLGRTNGLTNGLGRTNGITNGLGRTNGLTNGLGRARPAGFHSSGLRAMMRNAGWKLYLIPLVSVALLLMPLFFVPEYAGPAYPIRIDGVFDDWTPFSRLDTTTGSVSNANVDIVRFGVVDNLGPFAFYVQVRGIALQGGGPAPGTMDTVRVFIDIDGTRATGYQVDGLGADRMIEISGHGGSVLSSRLWEFDSNRDVRDWNGWIKGTGTPAAASASQIEATAEGIEPDRGRCVRACGVLGSTRRLERPPPQLGRRHTRDPLGTAGTQCDRRHRRPAHPAHTDRVSTARLPRFSRHSGDRHGARDGRLEPPTPRRRQYVEPGCPIRPRRHVHVPRSASPFGDLARTHRRRRLHARKR